MLAPPMPAKSARFLALQGAALRIRLRADALGNALGQGLVDAASATGHSAEEMAGDYQRESNRFAAAAAAPQPGDDGVYLSRAQEERLMSGRTVTDYGDAYADGVGTLADSTGAVRRNRGAVDELKSLLNEAKKLRAEMGQVGGSPSVSSGSSEGRSRLVLDPADDAGSSVAGPGLRLQVSGSSGNSLVARFASGAVHAAVDMAWQPVAQLLDLGQVAYGMSYNLLTDGVYEPHWFSGIGQNYATGMGYGETIARAALGSNPITGVGLSTYDLTSTALRGDWGGVAEGAGGLVGGFATAKLGQHWMAPQPGAELGLVRTRAEVDVASPVAGLIDLPGEHAPNFSGTPQPVRLGDAPLSRVFDSLDPTLRGARPNGSYWSETPYGNEATWRRGAAVQEGWNAGTLQGEWRPDPQWAWGGNAAPQPIRGSSVEKWGFSAGWIHKGGDYQIYVPGSYSKITPSDVVTQPTPWKKKP